MRTTIESVGVMPRALAEADASKDAKAQELQAIMGRVIGMNPHAAKPLRDPRRDFQVCRNITAAFRQHQDAPVPFRQLMFDEGHNFNLRVILGGKDRKLVEAADRFALLCIEATRRRHAIRRASARPIRRFRCSNAWNTRCTMAATA